MDGKPGFAFSFLFFLMALVCLGQRPFSGRCVSSQLLKQIEIDEW